MKIAERKILLTFDELRILLYSQGYSRCMGIYMPEKLFTAQEVVMAMQKLVQTGMLSLTEAMDESEALPLVFDEDMDAVDKQELFEVREDLLQMLQIIGEPRETEVLVTEHERYVFCYYGQSGIVTSERCREREHMVRLTLYEPMDFIEWRHSLEEKTE